MEVLLFLLLEDFRHGILPAIFLRFSLAKTTIHHSAKKNCWTMNNPSISSVLKRATVLKVSLKKIFNRRKGRTLIAMLKTSQIFLVLAILVNLLKI